MELTGLYVRFRRIMTAQFTFNSFGTFNQYTPTSGDTSKMYLKRSTDGVDFYEFISIPGNRTPNSLLMVLSPYYNYVNTPTFHEVLAYYMPLLTTFQSNVVWPTYNPTSFFFGEITNFVGYDPGSYFLNTHLDTTTTPGSIIATPQSTLPPADGTHHLGDVFIRATDEEAATAETILSGLTPRQKRIVELNDLLTSDPIFQALATQFVTSFGQPRAQVLLEQH
jgi:hypothetical protein